MVANESQRGVVVSILEQVWGNLGSNPHSVMNSLDYFRPLIFSQTNLPHTVVVRLKGERDTL